MQLVISPSGLRKVAHSDYADIPLTIAYAIAQHDSAFKLEGILNDDYIKAIHLALLSKREVAMNTVFKKIFRMDWRSNTEELKMSSNSNTSMHNSTDTVSVKESSLNVTRSSIVSSAGERPSTSSSIKAPPRSTAAPMNAKLTINESLEIMQSIAKVSEKSLDAIFQHCYSDSSDATRKPELLIPRYVNRVMQFKVPIAMDVIWHDIC